MTNATKHRANDDVIAAYFLRLLIDKRTVGGNAEMYMASV